MAIVINSVDAVLRRRLGAKLLAFREKHHLSQLSLAKYLGVAANTVARWERGERAIPPYLELALKAIESELSKIKKN